MPGRDKTGPQGMGSMTGRGLGFCNPNNSFSSQNDFNVRGRGMGLGRGQGRGVGRGFRRGNFPLEFNQNETIESLKAEVESLKSKLSDLEKQ